MTARVHTRVFGVLAGWVALTGPAAAQLPPLALPPAVPVEGRLLPLPPIPPGPPQAMPATKSTVRDAIVQTKLTLPEVQAPPAPPAELPQTLPAPAPLPVAPAPAPVPAPVPAPPPPTKPPVVGGLTVDGKAVDLSQFRNRLGGGCASCGHDDCESCGGSRHCSPGRKACEPFPATTRGERMIGVLYETVCCADPCYEPKWTILQDSAYYTASARPISHTRFRWDAAPGVVLPDRAEYFWARSDGQGLGPRPYSPNLTANRVTYHELHQYTELSVNGAFAIIVDTAYRVNKASGSAAGNGFGDMTTGTKTVLFDRELIQVAFQFLTHLPTGQPLKGTGVGHVALEPSVIVGLKVSGDTYLQAQVAQRIPLGGDPDYAGSVLEYHLSLNHLLWRPVRDVQLVGTCEFGGITFQDGAYTDPVLGSNRRAGGASYLTLGPGIRLNICDKIDFGVGSAFTVTDPHFSVAQFRSEFRYRY